MFGDIEIEGNKFYCAKTPFFCKRCRYWEGISI